MKKNPVFSIRKVVSILFLICTLLLLSVFNVLAQDCKFDFSRASRIDESKQVVGWMDNIYNASSDEVVIDGVPLTMQVTILIGSEHDSLIFVAMAIKLSEGTISNAEYVPAVKAAIGNEFTLRCKDAEPLVFVAANILNKTEMDYVWDQNVTTLLLVDYISEERLPQIVQAFNSCMIESFKIKLENNKVIDQPVLKKYGKILMEKGPCFERLLREKGKLK